MVRVFITALTLLSFTACTTLQSLPDAQAAHPGDKVEIVKADGTKLSFKVESVNDTTITGTDGAKSYEVPVSEVRSIGTRVMTTGDKTWTGVIAAVIVGGIVAAAGGGGGGGGSGY